MTQYSVWESVDCQTFKRITTTQNPKDYIATYGKLRHYYKFALLDDKGEEVGDLSEANVYYFEDVKG